MNKLTILPEAAWSDYGYIHQPAVLMTPGDTERPIHRLYVRPSSSDDSFDIYAEANHRVYVFPLEGAVESSEDQITFSSRGTMYTIRPFTDADGLWASALRIEVPAEALEEQYMAEGAASGSTTPAPGENLYAAIDEATNTVAHLVYSGGDGMYVRMDGAWARLPEGDTSLDDLTVMELDPAAVAEFDAANGSVEVDDMREFEIEFREDV